MENNLFQTIKESLKGQYGNVIAAILPGGKVQGNEHVCASLAGGPGHSCKTNTVTGVGQDFATGQKWADVIDLAAQAWGKTPLDAAYALAKQFGINVGKGDGKPAHQTGKTGTGKAAFTLIMPIPDSAPEFPERYRYAPRWCYRDANGMELCYSFRLDRPDGSKDFVPLCYCLDPAGNRQWNEMAPPAPRPLYGLDRLAEAAPAIPVLLVEGEKTADAAHALFPDHVCMTWMGGSNAVAKSDFSPLAGRTVLIWPDNDEPGIKAAMEIAGLLYKKKMEKAKIVYPPECLSEKWDLADPMPAGFSPQECIGNALDSDAFMRAVRYKHGDDRLGTAAMELIAEAEDLFVVPPWPTLSRDALPGFVGDFVDFAVSESEADPAAILATLFVRFGAEVYGHVGDKGPYIRVGNDRHPPRLFAVVCGNSSKARKGTSRRAITRLFDRDTCDSEELDKLRLPPPARESSGPLSSGEGLAYQLRDNAPLEDGRDPTDKRLCIMDEELASGLACTKREGNTLSTAIRTFWDGGDFAPLTKTNPVQVTKAHICILTHITEAELAAMFSTVQTMNGFGNRFLWISAKRSKLVALPQPMPTLELRDMQMRLWQLVKAAQTTGEVGLTPAAKEKWIVVYPSLSVETPGPSGAIVDRAEAQTIRLALIYALFDGKKVIDTPHLNAALALWKYASDSAARLFNTREADPVEQKVVSILSSGSCTATELSNLLSRHVTRAKLQGILTRLEAANRITLRQESTRGRPVTIITMRETMENAK